MTVRSPVVDRLAGVQFHGRSIIVWSARLDDEAAGWVRELVWTGTRILAVDGPLDEHVSGGVAAAALERWVSDRSVLSPPPPDIATDVPSEAEWATMTELWRRCGITPLTGTARTDPAWAHARRVDHTAGAATAATASRQSLRHPVGRSTATALVSCVAVAPAMRRRGIASACIGAVLPTADAPTAAHVGCADSAELFRHLGWRRDGDVHLYEHR